MSQNTTPIPVLNRTHSSSASSESTLSRGRTPSRSNLNSYPPDDPRGMSPRRSNDETDRLEEATRSAIREYVRLCQKKKEEEEEDEGYDCVIMMDG